MPNETALARYRVSATNDASKVFAQIQKSTEKMDKAFGVAAASARVFSAAIVTIAGGAFVRSLSATEKLRGSLKTATGSLDQAGAAFRELEKFAATTPFALEQSIEAFVKLKNLGLDPSQEALRSYGNTASAMGKDLNQFIEAVADASTNEFERLKEFGIKAKQQGDQVAFTFQGQTTIVRKNAEQIEGYLRNLGETKFGDAMADQMALLPGAISNANDAFQRLIRSIGDTGLTQVIADTFTFVGNKLNELSDFITSSDFVAQLQADFITLREQVAPIMDWLVESANWVSENIIGYFNNFTSYITGGEYSNAFRFIADGFLTLPVTAELAWASVTGVFRNAVTELQNYAGIIEINLVAGFQQAGLKIQEIWIEIKQGFATVIDFVTDKLSSLTDSIERTNFAEGYNQSLDEIKRKQLEVEIATSESLSEMQGWYIRQKDAVYDTVEALQREREAILANRDAQVAAIKAELDARNNIEFEGTGAPSSTVVTANVITPDFNISNIQSQIQSLTDNLFPVEQIQRQFEESLFVIEDAFQTQLISRQEYHSLVQALEADHQKKLTDLEREGLTKRQIFDRKTAFEKTKITLGELENITSGVAQHNKALFKVNKIAAIANAAVNMHQGVSKTLAEYSWPYAGILAAAHAAAGIARINAIRSTSFNGSGSGIAPSQGGTTSIPVTETGNSSTNTPSTDSQQTTTINNYFIGDLIDEQKAQDLIATQLPQAYDSDKIAFPNGIPTSTVRVA